LMLEKRCVPVPSTNWCSKNAAFWRHQQIDARKTLRSDTVNKLMLEKRSVLTPSTNWCSKNAAFWHHQQIFRVIKGAGEDKVSLFLP